MAKKYKVDVTVYNPVEEQNKYMQERFKRHGVEDRIRLVNGGHRHIANEPNSFDKYVSIGVYEHVGSREKGYHMWMESIAAALKEGGTGFISFASFMHKGMTNYLTLKYIFPGGHIPSLPLTLEAMEEANLNMVEVENLWPHYHRTAEEWRNNIKQHKDEISNINPEFFTERFHRIWNMYIEGTCDVFKNGMDLSHIVFTKGRHPDYYPWDRGVFHKEAQFMEDNAKPPTYHF